MTTELRTRRARIAGQVVVAALAMAVLAFVTLSINARSLRDEPAGGLVAPELSERIDAVSTVRITTSQGVMTMARTDAGWVMRERGDFPVRADRLGQLADGLREMAFQRRMTSDPDKFARIGLDDPTQGGRGALLQLEDADGALVVDLIVGVETDAGGLYARRATQNQAWAVSGELPALRDVASWLAIAPIPVDSLKINRVDITPATGRAYSLLPLVLGESTGFSFAPPLRGIAARSNLELQEVAGRLGNLEPIDVSPAVAVQGAPRARINVSTTDNIVIDAQIISVAEGGDWLKVSARNAVDTPEALAAAATINQGAGQWAYKLSETEAESLAPVFETLLPQAAQPLPESLPLTPR